MEWKYSENRKQIIIDKELKQFKYLTGTRLASALGLNPYSSPFMCWAECTKLITPPFEDNMYTIAGKTIEPVQREYISKKFPNVKGPEEYFGNIYDSVRWNFFTEEDKPFAGLWDAVCTKDNGKDITMVIEFKTANSAAKWANNNVPEYYLLQGALYARLLGLDKVLFVASFLDQLDYANPSSFVPNETNTIMIVKKIDELVFDVNGEYLSFDECLEKARLFWDTYVKTGISPEFNEIKDKEYLDIIRKSKPANDNDLITLCDEAVAISNEIKLQKEQSGINRMEKELKVLKDAIKTTMIEQNLDYCGAYKLTRVEKEVLNEKLLAQKDKKLYDSCIETTVSYKLTEKIEEE